MGVFLPVKCMCFVFKVERFANGRGLVFTGEVKVIRSFHEQEKGVLVSAHTASWISGPPFTNAGSFS
mgnify:FL=1